MVDDTLDGQDTASPPQTGSGIASTATSLLGHDSRSIVPFLRSNGETLDSIHSNWCGAFVNATLAANGVAPVSGPGKDVATSYMRWGQPVAGAPQPGDVLVLPRGQQPGATGGHVGIATGQVASGPGGTFYLMSSGNQNGGKVDYSWEPAGSVVARRAAPATGGAVVAQAQSSDDLLERMNKIAPPAAPQPATGGAASGAPATAAQDAAPSSDDLMARMNAIAPVAATAKPAEGEQTTTVRGAARNVAAGVLQGAGGAINFLSDPAGNLMRIPLTAGAFLYDAGARASGLYNPLTPEQRADLTSDTDTPQPGTRLVEAIAQPSQVPANTQTENLLRAAAAGGMGGLLIPGLIGPVAGASGAVTGNVAAQAVPDWAKPAAELAGNVVGGAAPFAVRPAVNALVQGAQKAAGPPLPANYSPLAPRVLSPQFEQAPLAPELQQRLAAGPQPGMGAAQPAGAQVSTAAQAAMTPEEAANSRTVANKQWLNDPVQPGIRDPNADIPGITLNLAEQEQTVQAARELKSLKTANPELSQEEKLILDKNTRERKAFFDETIGSDITRAADLKTANTKIENDLANVWKGKKDADPAATKAQIQTELDSSAGDLPPVQSAMRQISDSLEKAGADPQAMYRTHRLINYLQSKVGQLANPGYGSDSVQAALTRVKATLKGDINNAAPGFDKAMSNYATARGPIDAAKALQDRENGLYDSRGHMQFLPVHKLVRDIIEAQRWDAPDHPLQFVSDEQMARLKTLHDNLKRVASAQDLAAARGSDTVQNAVDLAKGIVKAGGAVAAHAVANKVAPVVGSFVVNALGQAIERGRAARTQRRQMQRGMEMLNPRPTNPLQQGPP